MNEELRYGEFIDPEEFEDIEFNFIALLQEFVRRKNNVLEDNKNGSEDSRVYR